uniref:Uncharacterized protein n=1 Tax=Arundo donax TaxID=35708 RepID=A0A0A9CEN1_ARUDO
MSKHLQNNQARGVKNTTAPKPQPSD